MITKILVASVFAVSIATSAMAQSSGYTSHTRHRPLSQMTVDPNTTGSVNGDTSGLNVRGNPGPAGPCASSSAGPDANAGSNVNDQYCGK
jgi:hypothetical protein